MLFGGISRSTILFSLGALLSVRQIHAVLQSGETCATGPAYIIYPITTDVGRVGQFGYCGSDPRGQSLGKRFSVSDLKHGKLVSGSSSRPALPTPGQRTPGITD